MKIIAVVVTYNRLELLKRNIDCLRQNTPLTSIVVVNNGSTDGTTQWLAAQPDLQVINQENVGGSGGFYTGIEYAYKAGFIDVISSVSPRSGFGNSPSSSSSWIL